LAKETVERLEELFDILGKPSPDDLEELEKEDLNLIGAALKELDSDLLLDRIRKYNPSRAKNVMEWLADDSSVFEVFEAAGDDDLKKMIVALLDKADDSKTGDEGVLAGLSVNVEREDDDDEKNIIALALDQGNEDLALYIHNELIGNEDDEICEKGNHPSFGNTNTVDCMYIQVAGSANEFALEACILAAYCKIAPDDNKQDNDFRKDIAEFLSEQRDFRQIEQFIKDPKQSGGLDLDEDSAEGWTHDVCEQLDTCWKNGNLDLGLGERI